jgi:hypothetical protein
VRSARLERLRQRLINAVLARDERGPLFRTLAVVVVMALIWLAAALVERPTPDPAVLENLAATQGAAYFIVAPFELALYALLHPSVLRHLFLPALVIALGIYAGASYLNNLFELRGVRKTASYLFGSLFGLSYDYIEVKDGGLTAESLTKRVHEIGGPGYLKVHLGNAALFERVGNRSSVYSATPHHFLHGFERLREQVIDLRDQIRSLGDMTVYTKDGIPVKAIQAEVVFRVASAQSRSQAAPYPFEEKAVRRLIYGQLVVEAKGKAKSWTDMLAELAREEIAHYVGSRLLKELIAQKQKGSLPPPPSANLDTSQNQGSPPTPRAQVLANAREPLTLSFYNNNFARRCEKLGVRLIWIGVGTLETPEELSQELIGAWYAEFEALIKNNALDLAKEKTNIHKAAIRSFLENLRDYWLKHTALPADQQQPLPTAEWPSAYDIVRLYSIRLHELRRSTHQPLEPEVERALEYLEDLARPHIIGEEGDEAE